jgi:NAD(P)-dependent dehydrogenase (short-subunit alcohol dehydrogenase family)
MPSPSAPPTVALVTGANRGIGLAVAARLAREGHLVVMGGRDLAAVGAAAAPLAAAGLPVRAERLDVADDGSVEACAARLRRDGLLVDRLLNVAGVLPEAPLLGPGGLEALEEGLQVNALGAARTARAFAPGMARRRFGRIVNVSSGWGSFAEGLEGPAAYAVSKAALNAVTVKLAQELSGAGDLLVNACCPGWVRTRMGGGAAPLSPEEGADTAAWLATLPAGGPTGGFFRDRRPIRW